MLEAGPVALEVRSARFDFAARTPGMHWNQVKMLLMAMCQLVKPLKMPIAPQVHCVAYLKKSIAKARVRFRRHGCAGFLIWM